MTEKKKTNRSRWKTLFFGLFILNLIMLTAILALIFWPVDSTEIDYEDRLTSQESSEFVVRTTKTNLNDLINAYIEKLTDGTKHSYRISLDEDVHLEGELPVFSTTVPLSVHLVPFVQENGDVILKQKSISVGLLQLPNKKILEYMEKFLPVPDWVKIDAKEEEIYVAVTEMDIKSNFKVKVESFDIEENNLAFRINIPYKTLGIDPSE